MAELTTIGWTDHTFNPWWGCLKISPACEHCYACDQANRFGHAVWGLASNTQRRTFGEAHWKMPLKWNTRAAVEGRRFRVSCASMADVFEDHAQLPPLRARVWDLIERTPQLDWQLLTKGPENIMGMVPEAWSRGFPANVWVGTSVENQEWLDRRSEALLTVPAAVRFMSCEPLLGPLMLSAANPNLIGPNAINWLIVGGESGPRARPMELDWARRIVWQGRNAAVPVYVKQLGAAHAPGRFDAKGEDWEWWPGDLRVREFPA